MTASLDVIIANGDAKTINVPYKPHEAILFLIGRIRAALGIDEDSIICQNLFLNGIRLKDHHQTMAYYRIFGHTLTYRSRVYSKKDISLYVNTISGKTIVIHCHPNSTIEVVKQLIQEKENIPPENQRLIFASKQLVESRTLLDYCIGKDSTLHVLLRLRGGKNVRGTMFADVSDTSGVRKIEFSKNAPPGLATCCGTNVECECECTPAYDVICRKHFGTIELSDETFTCPNCHSSENNVPITVGFVKCKYRFHGIKGSGEQYTSDWKNVEEADLYQQFKPDKKIHWRRLVIESAPLHAYDECTICLKELRLFKTLDCGYRFHSACIENWKGSCPNCSHNKHLTTGRVL
ncbi:MAG: hypothetical protein J3R72DRAFT_455513 [Linnemannia gamsii]|nr:MAG: hypothetical protein J3R72DRAFT_455513 [Linnemannia gamsii]